MDEKVVRVLPHIIDTVLLLSAITLMIMSRQYPTEAAWITAKIVALLGYILAGTVFMRFARKGWEQLLSYAVALFIAAYIISVALSKSAFLW